MEVNKLGIDNPLLDTDSYKASHSFQYPPRTEYVYSYIESRGGVVPETVFFGLQMFLKQYWQNNPITRQQIDEAEQVWTQHGEPFDRKMWDLIVDEFKGYPPLEIRAVAEGLVTPNSNVLLTITNTDPRCAAAVSFFETALLRAIWYPTTVASNSRWAKKIMKSCFDKTSDQPDGIIFKLHDFGARGVSSKESAGIGGAGHLVSFMGTDTMTAIQFVKKYYGDPMAGFSIPAGEHSTVTTWGKNRQVDFLNNMIDKFGRTGSMFAVPIDSYDTWDFISNVVESCKEKLIASGSTFILRPDSGDPLTVPVKVIDRAFSLYGGTVNSKGYKVLPAYLRAIQGDGITIDTIPVILQNLTNAGYSIDNLAFGCGGGLLQHPNRDDYKFAMKCSAAKIEGKWTDVFKDPIDQPDKKSKKGRFVVARRHDGSIITFNAVGYDLAVATDLLQPVWRNGILLRETDFKAIRKRAEV